MTMLGMYSVSVSYVYVLRYASTSFMFLLSAYLVFMNVIRVTSSLAHYFGTVMQKFKYENLFFIATKVYCISP